MTEQLLAFVDKGVSSFHVVEEICNKLQEAGFEPLREEDVWELKPQGKYYIVRNGSSVAAVTMPKEEPDGFHIVAAHSDSPTFKIKANPQITVEEQYVKLNTEKYGGMILSSWLDRPLSVAGRIVVKEGDAFVTKNVNIDKDLLLIPNVAIHMNRDMNKGVEYNAQTDMLPLYAGAGAENGSDFLQEVAMAAGVETTEILDSDLFLYVREKGKLFGANKEFICAPRLDDLECAFGATEAITTAGNAERFCNVSVIFDNEEVGSGTKQGADSTFLTDILTRIQESFGKDKSWLCRMIANSFMISADNAHAVHPNHPEKADPTNRPYLNGGIVIKYHGSQKYTTDALSAAVMRDLCKRAEVPVQTYCNRSDIAGGSTLGNISTAHVSVNTVDIGLAQLAMHSAVETAGAKDVAYLVKVLQVFFAQ